MIQSNGMGGGQERSLCSTQSSRDPGFFQPAVLLQSSAVVPNPSVHGRIPWIHALLGPTSRVSDLVGLGCVSRMNFEHVPGSCAREWSQQPILSSTAGEPLGTAFSIQPADAEDDA